MKKLIFPAILILAVTFTSCRKKATEPEPEPEPTPTTPSYVVPTTYTFSVMEYTASVQYIDMLGEMTGYIKTAQTTTATPALSGTKLADMYINAGGQFTNTTINTSTLQLRNQTSTTFSLHTQVDGILSDVALITATTPTASNGVAGKLVSGTKAYIVDANGLEHKEALEKGIMGGVFYYQAMLRLTSISSYDNSTVIAGQGTAQEHAWDVAFGLFGVPVAFPTSTVGLKNWGSYCNSVNASIGSNATIMNAFLKGRAAITNKDAAGRDQARDIVVATWEKVAAARCITYLKGAKTNITDDAVRSHNLSEAIGFVKAFRYNPSKTITDTEISNLEGFIGTNFYTISITDIDNAINALATKFSLNPNTL